VNLYSLLVYIESTGEESPKDPRNFFSIQEKGKRSGTFKNHA